MPVNSPELPILMAPNLDQLNELTQEDGKRFFTFSLETPCGHILTRVAYAKSILVNGDECTIEVTGERFEHAPSPLAARLMERPRGRGASIWQIKTTRFARAVLVYGESYCYFR